MSPMQNLEAALNDAVDETVRTGTVLQFTGTPRPAAGGSLEEHSDFHRLAAAEYAKRRTEARRDGKAAAAAFRAERKALLDQYNADLAAIAGREEQSKTDIAERILTAETLGEVERTSAALIEKRL